MRIATPSAKIIEASNTGTRKKSSGPSGSPSIKWIKPKMKKVGKNLKNDMTVAEIGRINLGKAEFSTNLPPLVIDFEPAIIEFVIK